MSYELATKRHQELHDLNFRIAIADEAHYMKSRGAKRSRLLIPILRKAKRCLLLTGTPILNHPVEIYNLLKIIRPDIWISFVEYTQRYCDPKKRQQIIRGPAAAQMHHGTRMGEGVLTERNDYSGAACIDELNFILSKHLMMRRLKVDVLGELPEKTR